MEDPLRTARETTCGIYDNEGCAFRNASHIQIHTMITRVTYANSGQPINLAVKGGGEK